MTKSPIHPSLPPKDNVLWYIEASRNCVVGNAKFLITPRLFNAVFMEEISPSKCLPLIIDL